MDVDVDEHALKHGLAEAEIKFAWEHRIKMRHRPVPNEQFAVAVGCVPDGGTSRWLPCKTIVVTLYSMRWLLRKSECSTNWGWEGEQRDDYRKRCPIEVWVVSS